MRRKSGTTAEQLVQEQPSHLEPLAPVEAGPPATTETANELLRRFGNARRDERCSTIGLAGVADNSSLRISRRREAQGRAT